MHDIDPYDPGESIYECQYCGNRTQTSDYLTVCPNCEGDVRNIGVPRE